MQCFKRSNAPFGYLGYIIAKQQQFRKLTTVDVALSGRPTMARQKNSAQIAPV
jgi:hypothetical protein